MISLPSLRHLDPDDLNHLATWSQLLSRNPDPQVREWARPALGCIRDEQNLRRGTNPACAPFPSLRTVPTTAALVTIANAVASLHARTRSATLRPWAARLQHLALAELDARMTGHVIPDLALLDPPDLARLIAWSGLLRNHSDPSCARWFRAAWACVVKEQRSRSGDDPPPIHAPWPSFIELPTGALVDVGKAIATLHARASTTLRTWVEQISDCAVAELASRIEDVDYA